MAILKCKSCGGDLEIVDNSGVYECEYCGLQQTVAKTQDEGLSGLYNRANALRLKCDFDKAEALYEKILQSDEEQAEAHWGLILCKYGIEYVEDPKTHKRIPTCHRTSYESVIADDEFKSALQYADLLQRSLYEAEAKEIDRLQKEILALCEKEEPYDVFICYKETDAVGKRTQDSVIANDIYYQLTQEGFKVFYAAVTLEDKLGSAYEPCIFAALNSAKVMLVIGTKSEYFNAVWVKNEWSRFLKMIKKDRSKVLIPCYRDMDAYDLPEEFAHLQAQDMSKIGFINDVVRGIKKLVVKEEPKAAPVAVPVAAAPVAAVSGNASPMLKRAFMFLEDGDWTRADDFCEQVLNTDPECAEAYLGKMLAEMRLHTQAQLKNCAKPFEDNRHYQKAIRFGSAALVEELKGYNQYINDRNTEATYNKAVSLMANVDYEAGLKEAAGLFEQVRNYKDSAQRAAECRALAKEAALSTTYNTAVRQMNRATTEDGYREAARTFGSIRHYKDAATLEEQCRANAEIAHKDRIYSLAMTNENKRTIPSLEDAVNQYSSISEWKDSAARAANCRAMLDQLIKQKEREAKRNPPAYGGNFAELEKLKKQRRNSLIWGVIFLFVWWPLGVGLLIRAVKKGKEIQENVVTIHKRNL